MPTSKTLLALRTTWACILGSFLTLTACAQTADKASTQPDTKSDKVISTASTTTTANNITPQDAQSLKPILLKKLEQAGIKGATIDSISTTPIAQLYWVKLKGMPGLYVSKDGSYMVQGDILQFTDKGFDNLTENLQSVDAKKLLESIPLSEQIIFAPANPKAHVYAFTDVECGYCRKLHSEIKEINAKGIAVHYLAWPRAQQFVQPLVNVWCSPDRKAALTAAKMGQPVSAPACNAPVMKHHQIGEELGVQGTPSVYDANGKHLGGYMTADQMAEALGIN